MTNGTAAAPRATDRPLPGDEIVLAQADHLRGMTFRQIRALTPTARAYRRAVLTRAAALNPAPAGR
jgi:hypothetical protein